MSNKITFVEFIEKNDIEIPLIQRDYVQGTALDPKAIEKRNEFVQKLMNALLPDGKPYNLDFIYGAHESFDTEQKVQGKAFLPLDGQQRLTTLFLLHWILLIKNTASDENEVRELNERMVKLQRFSYKTRISSGRFCSKITSTDFDKDISLIEQIKDMYWFDNDMANDPTIKSMMDMIETMENMVDNEFHEYKHDMLDNIYNNNGMRITFDILDMDKYHLTDNLYVKMNARGKELTPFENWKADFIDLLTDNKENKDKFSDSIEHEWNNVFWEDVYRKYIILKEENENVSYPRIDENFMNFFYNITRLLFFIHFNKENLKADDFKTGLWANVKKVYENNITIQKELFDILDTLSEIYKSNENIDSFFNDIFYVGNSITNKENGYKVNLIKENENNLFKIAYTNDNFSWLHVMLYAILSYCNKHKIYTVDENLCNFVRLCRNYLYEINYFDSNSVEVVPQIRANDMYKYKKVFEYFYNDANPFISLESNYDDTNTKNEQVKLKYYVNPNTLNLVRKLEDTNYTYGNIKSFTSVLDSCLEDDSRCDNVGKAILSFFNTNAVNKVRLFIALGYEGINVKNCAYGRAVFLGGDFGKPRWMVHFRKKYNDIHPLDNFFKKYVEEFSIYKEPEKILNSKIVKHASTPKEYMVKYKHIVASQIHWRNNENEAPFYFAMKNPWKELDIITIHSISMSPLSRAYQVCPMANAVVRKLKKYVAHEKEGRMGYAGQCATKNGIIINEGRNWDKILLCLHFGKKEWRIYGSEINNLPCAIMAYLNFDGTNYILNSTEDKDLVEIGIEFMNLIIDEFENKGLL